MPLRPLQPLPCSGLLLHLQLRPYVCLDFTLWLDPCLALFNAPFLASFRSGFLTSSPAQ